MFAALLGESVRTLHDWVQGPRAPIDAAHTLLPVTDKNSKALLAIAWSGVGT